MVWLMVFNSTFNNISVISWRSVLLVEETRVPGENNWSAVSHRHLAWVGFKLTTLVVICTDRIGGCKSNYHMITTTTTPPLYMVILMGIIIYTLLYFCIFKPYGHKTNFKFKFWTHAPKSSNQNNVFIGYDVLNGCFFSMRTKLVLESFTAGRPSI